MRWLRIAISFTVTLLTLLCMLPAQAAQGSGWSVLLDDQGNLQLSDIRAADFDPAAIGYSLAQLQNLLHGRFADGHWVTGLDATYWSWTAAGHTWLARPLGWRWLRPTLNSLYRLFCRLRPGLTWLPHPDGARRCQAELCKIDKKQT